MKIKICLSLLPVAGLLAFAGCSATPQMTQRPDFLSTYNHLQKVDDTTWRYVSPPLLANCNQFIVSPVKVMFTSIDGNPISPEQRQKASDFVRRTITQAVSQRYTVVSDPGANVAEIRVAVTEAYRTGGKLGLCVQGEIVDNSNTQVAAVIKTELSELFVADWEDKASAREMVGNWAQRLVKTIDDAHAR